MQDDPFGTALFSDKHDSPESLLPDFVKHLPEGYRNQLETIVFNLHEDIKCLREDVARLESQVEGAPDCEPDSLARESAETTKAKFLMEVMSGNPKILEAHLQTMPPYIFEVIVNYGDTEHLEHAKSHLDVNKGALREILNECRENELLVLAGLMKENKDVLEILACSTNIDVAEAALINAKLNYPEIFESEMKAVIASMSSLTPVKPEKIDMLKRLKREIYVDGEV
ncbi:hypothetical protein [Vibrio crassostreae]|uniref:hypothetical protein n=1 Tax=Vibrio crassostreae TaxID=246167 RepID=UPI001B309142|nr:hypothetical protein [Vibrio crassostreae]